MCMRGRPADPGVECCLAFWQLKGKRENTLWCTQRYCTDTCTCVAYRKAHMQDSSAHTHRQCCAILFPPDACCIILPTIHLEMHETEIPVGCCARAYGSTLYNCPLGLWFEPWWWAESKLRQHPFEVSLTSREQQTILLWANYNNVPRPIVHSLTAQTCEEKPSGPELAVPLAPSVKNMTVTATSFTARCCFKVVDVSDCQTPLWNCTVLCQINSPFEC